MAKKAATRKGPVKAATLQLTLSDLKKITTAGSSFGGDTWQQIHWGRPPTIAVSLEPFPGEAGTIAKKLAKGKLKSAAKRIAKKAAKK